MPISYPKTVYDKYIVMMKTLEKSYVEAFLPLEIYLRSIINGQTIHYNAYTTASDTNKYLMIE